MAKKKSHLFTYFSIHVQYEVHILGKKSSEKKSGWEGREEKGGREKNEQSFLEAMK